MLIIRDAQMDLFKRAAMGTFEDEMVTHSREFSPRHCRVIGETNVRSAVGTAIERGMSYGFTQHGPLRLYIELMWMFGSAFDTDPQLPWANEILTAGELPDQMDRAQSLYERVLRYLQDVCGPGHVNSLRAMEDIIALYSARVHFSDADLESEVLANMNRVYPSKFSHAGEGAFRQIIEKSCDKALAYGMTSAHARSLVCMLMFVAGHGFDEDPLFPWASHTLRDAKINDAEARARRLQKKSIAYLKGVLTNMGRSSARV